MALPWQRIGGGLQDIAEVVAVQREQLEQFADRRARGGQAQRQAARMQVAPHGQQQLHAGAVDLADPAQVQLQPGRAVGEGRQQNQAQLGGTVDVEFAVERQDGQGIAHGSTSFSTADSSTGGWKGLTTQALAPAIWPSRFLASWLSVVSMITGVKR